MVAQSQEKTKPAIDRVPIRRALISVYDKTGLDVLARAESSFIPPAERKNI